METNAIEPDIVQCSAKQVVSVARCSQVHLRKSEEVRADIF